MSIMDKYGNRRPIPSKDTDIPEQFRNIFAKYNGVDYMDPQSYDYSDLKTLEAKGLLVKGKIYKVTNIDVGGSSTLVSLQGIKQGLNSAAFEFGKRQGNKFVKFDIYSDPNINPYLQGMDR